MLACNLFGNKPSPEPMLIYCQLNLMTEIQSNFNQNAKIFFQKGSVKNVINKAECQFFSGYNVLNKVILKHILVFQCLMLLRWFNSLWPSDTSWHQRMTCCPKSPCYYPNHSCSIVNFTLRNIFQWNFTWNSKVFITGNASENVLCKMLAIWVIFSKCNFSFSCCSQ